jgi:hypothetical protein
LVVDREVDVGEGAAEASDKSLETFQPGQLSGSGIVIDIACGYDLIHYGQIATVKDLLKEPAEHGLILFR